MTFSGHDDSTINIVLGLLLLLLLLLSTYELLSKNQLTEFVFYCLFHFAID